MFKDMKKLEYIAPELEEIKLIQNSALLNMSEGDAGTTDPDDPERE